MKNKHPLLRDVKIKVYWRDKLSGQIKSGELWDVIYSILEIPIDEQGFTGREKETGMIKYNVKGDNGRFYSFTLKELSLDIKDLAN